MKRWLAITLGVGLQVAQIFSMQLQDQRIREATQTLIVAAAGVIAKKTSETNPDGTPAEASWEKKK